jgi:hypothetical protein
LNTQQLEWLISQAISWVRRQQKKFRPSALPINETEKEIMKPFFGSEVLSCARFIIVPRIENPEFYKSIGKVPLDFSQMWGITFIDTICVVTSRMSAPLLFHELVHVCQYQLLGADQFIRRYVLGWANGGFEYRNIPLEKQAYRLQGLYDSIGKSFSVEDIVCQEMDITR